MKKENIVTIIVLIVLGIELLSLPVNFLIHSAQETSNHRKNIKWEELYPFQEENVESKETVLDKYKRLSVSVTQKFEKLANEYSFCRNEIVGLYGCLNKAIGMRVIRDSETTTVVLESGGLNYMYDNNSYIEQNISDVVALNDYVHEQDMEFIYMQAPLKLFDDEDVIPGCIDNYIDQDKDYLCEQLSDAGVDVFDVREYMPTAYDEYMTWFYSTDHHWKPEAGLYITSVLAEHLNDDYEFCVDTEIYEPTLYEFQTYPSTFLGSQGKKVTLGYTQAEDFTLITPSAELNWYVSIPREEVEGTGGFGLILDESQLTTKDLYLANPYATYTYGDQPHMSIVNNDEDVKGNVLIIGDSYSEVIVPFLAMGCQQVDRIDLRSFKGSLRTYLAENDYDVVILLESRAGEEYDVNEHNSNWDFR